MMKRVAEKRRINAVRAAAQPMTMDAFMRQTAALVRYLNRRQGWTPPWKPSTHRFVR